MVQNVPLCRTYFRAFFALVHHAQGARGRDRTHHCQTSRGIQFVKTSTTRKRAVDGEPIVSTDTPAQSAMDHTQNPSAGQRARIRPPLQTETKEISGPILT